MSEREESGAGEAGMEVVGEPVGALSSISIPPILKEAAAFSAGAADALGEGAAGGSFIKDSKLKAGVVSSVNTAGC